MSMPVNKSASASAFGVVHKSYVNGVWRPITKVPKDELFAARDAGLIGQKSMDEVKAMRRALTGIPTNARKPITAATKETVKAYKEAGVSTKVPKGSVELSPGHYEHKRPDLGAIESHSRMGRKGGKNVTVDEIGTGPEKPSTIKELKDTLFFDDYNAKNFMRPETARKLLPRHERVHGAEGHSLPENLVKERIRAANRAVDRQLASGGFRQLKKPKKGKPAKFESDNKTFKRVNGDTIRESKGIRLRREMQADNIARRDIMRETGKAPDWVPGHLDEHGSPLQYMRQNRKMEESMGLPKTTDDQIWNKEGLDWARYEEKMNKKKPKWY